MIQDAFHHPRTDSAVPVHAIENDITQPRRRCIVRDNPGETDVDGILMQKETQRVSEELFDHFHRAFVSPVRGLEQLVRGAFRIGMPVRRKKV